MKSKMIGFITVLSIMAGFFVMPHTAMAEEKKYMHFSFDDVYECMENLNTKNYTSVFEEPLLVSLKVLHETYGAVFTLNCFLEGSNTSSSYAYKLSEITDKYKDEIAGASSWLKFAFHAKNRDAKYSSDSSDLANQYKTFTDTIVKIAGADSIDRVTRLGFFTGSLNNMLTLKNSDYGLVGFLTADDSREDNYYLNLYDRNYVADNNIWYDADNDLAAIHTQLRLESVSNAAAREAQLAAIAKIDNGNATMVEVFTHESEFAKDFVKENFEEYIKWAKDNGYTFDFAENHITEIQAWQTENPRVDAVTLPEGNADLEWDFSKFTGSEAKKGAVGEIDYDGLKINLTANDDKIEASSTFAQNGLYWRGQSNRYAKYTPTADGIIVAQIKTKSGGGSMKLTDSSGATAAEGNILDGYLIYDGCKAGETYSFIPTADYQRIMNVKYYKTGDEPNETPEPELDDKVYYITAEAEGDETVVDAAALYAPEFVKEYQVTTADLEGKKVKQYRVEKADSVTADTTGAARVEIAPVFKFSRKVSASDGSYLGMDDLHSKVKLPGSYDSGRYDFTFIKALGKNVTDKNAANIDIYVNDGMVANNLYYTGYLRTIAKGTEVTYTAHDVVIDADKGVELYSSATSQTGMDTVEVVKSPSIVNRVKKVWVIGDSLVQKYYGSLYKKSDSTTDKNMQCGWGQFLADYLTDEVEVVNLAKAGDYAGNLKSTAFTGVSANGQAGDIVIIEGGYNDYKKSNQTAFENAMTTMYAGAAEKNMIPVIVTPNCSMTVETVNGTELDDYSDNLRFASQGRTLAEANEWNLVDLAKLSYDFYSKTYGTDAAARGIITSTYLFPSSLGEGAEADIDDILHHNELGAERWASMVVQELYDKKILQDSEVDSENEYSYIDTAGNSFTLCIKTSAIEPVKQITKITVDYDEHGVLIDIKTEQVDASAVPETVNNTAARKVFYWDSLNSMKPYVTLKE